MSSWRSGDIVAAAAGCVLVVAALSPWVVGSGIASSASKAGQQSLFVVTIVTGLGLLISGLARTSWTGLVALLSGLVAGITVFSAAIPAHAVGARPGFGLFALAAGGVTAVVGGVLNAIERPGASL